MKNVRRQTNVKAMREVKRKNDTRMRTKERKKKGEVKER
jgi:hypothetical protein